MEWSDVGNFLKANSKGMVGLVGSLLTGNVAGAIGAGASMVATATGTTDPKEALETLQHDPDSMIALEQIALERKQEINRHLERVLELETQDKQHAHSQTQQTIRNGDSQESKIRWVRPSHATISLLAGIYYGLTADTPEVAVLGAFFTLPFTYAGLREVGKGILAFKSK